MLALTAQTALGQGQEPQATSLEKNQQIIGEFIDSVRDKPNITTIEIGKTMTKMLAVKLFENGDDESAKLLRSIDTINILVEASEGDSLSAMFSLPIECEHFDLISSISKEGELTHFYFADHPKSETCEFLMLVRTPSERIVLYITGQFSISDISALSSLGEGFTKN